MRICILKVKFLFLWYEFAKSMDISFLLRACCCSVAKSCLALCNLVQLFATLSNSLQPCRLPHTRLLCPPLSPRVCSNLCSLSHLWACFKYKTLFKIESILLKLLEIPGLGRSPGEEKGYPLQWSGLENSMHCVIHGIAKGQTQLNDFHITSF